MPRRKEVERFARVGVKDCWHPYGLQALTPEKFVVVTSHILSGEFDLLEMKNGRHPHDDFREDLKLIYGASGI
jgi:hypothetical protein